MQNPLCVLGVEYPIPVRLPSGIRSRLGGPGWLSTQGSRRPVRTQLTHTVPLSMDLLPKGIRRTIRWRLGGVLP